jgi:hypothetical protein
MARSLSRGAHAPAARPARLHHTISRAWRGAAAAKITESGPGRWSADHVRAHIVPRPPGTHSSPIILALTTATNPTANHRRVHSGRSRRRWISIPRIVCPRRWTGKIAFVWESRLCPQFESNPTGTRVISRRTSVSAVRRGELGSPLQIVVSSVLRNALRLPLRTSAIGVEFRGGNRRWRMLRQWCRRHWSVRRRSLSSVWGGADWPPNQF